MIHRGRWPLDAADLVTVALLVVAPVLRLALLTGPTGSDDVNYFHFSQQLLHFEHFDKLHHHGGRLFFLILAGIPAAVTGSIAGGAVANVVFVSARDVLVALFVRGRVGPIGAAMAASVLSVNGLSAAYSGILAPDPLLSLMMFASALLAFLAIDEDRRRPYQLVLAAGALAAVSYSVKEAGILVVPTALAWLALAGRMPFTRRLQLLIGYVLAFAAVAIFEMAAYWLLSGDPLYRIHAISAVHNASMVESHNLYEFVRSGYWNLELLTRPETASLPVLVLAAAVWAYSFAKRDGLFLFAAAGTFIGLYLIFGTSSFARLVPLPVEDRYFEPLIPFLAVSVGALGGRFSSIARLTIPWMPVAFAAALAAVSLPGVIYNAGDITFSALGKNAAIAINAVKRTSPDMPIFLSPQMMHSIEPFVEPAVYRSLSAMPRDAPLDRGFYVLHPWKEPAGQDQPFAAVALLPVALVIDEDQRLLARLYWRRGGEGKAITVHERR